MEENIRIGNDIEVLWAIYAGEGVNETPYDLTNKDLTLYLVNAFGKQKAEGFTTDGHIIKWRFFGKEQKHTGRYSLILVENEGKEGMHTVDSCDAFNLTRSSCESCGCGNTRVEVVTLQLKGYLSAVWPRIDEELDADSPYPVSNQTLTKKFEEMQQQLAAYAEIAKKELEDAVAILAPTPDFSENFNNDFTI